nr:unnamed protein product [Digitaria exilis]
MKEEASKQQQPLLLHEEVSKRQKLDGEAKLEEEVSKQQNLEEEVRDEVGSSNHPSFSLVTSGQTQIL